MPAYAQRQSSTRPRERVYALAAVVLIQAALGFALLTGLKVSLYRSTSSVQRLIEIVIPKPPPMVVTPRPKPVRRSSSAPKAEAKPLGGSPGPKPAHASPSVAPVVPLHPTLAPSGGGSGTGPALGSGGGGGSGGQGYGADEGGTDIEQIAGEIRGSDYPKQLGNSDIGGHVSVTFTVQVNGRVTGCHVTRSSGVSELDTLTCRLIEDRFRFRPSTDRNGRPISEEVDYDHDWIAPH
jgi:protein TonB